jgi:hypothetical protein
MKELRLPKEQAVRFRQEVGGANPSAWRSNDLAVIERNGAELLTATVMLERRMIEAVCCLLFPGEEADVQREFFEEEVIGTSDFTFAFKRRVFTRLLERTGALDAKAVAELKAGLNKVMEWRNAFAHGTLVHESTGGVVLMYYSGGHKELVLDDAFFEKVEDTVRSCLYQCNGIIQSV